MIDSHIHLCSFSEPDREFIKLGEDGIDKVIVPSIDLASSEKAIEFARKHSGVMTAIGIHPKSITKGFRANPVGQLSFKTKLRFLKEETDNLVRLKAEIEKLEDMILPNQKLIKAIGEIGLDATTGRVQDLELQEIAFKLQLEISFRHQLPVILHLRSGNADGEDIYSKASNIIASYTKDFRGVIHAFAGPPESARAFLSIGRETYVGIGYALLNDKWHGLTETIKDIEIARLLIETDAPFSTYEEANQHMSTPSEGLKLITERIAQIKGISVEAVTNQTAENARRLFNVPL